MSKLFISYRRRSWPFAKQIRDELVEHLDANIFIDIDGVADPDFEKSILGELRKCDAFLLIVTDRTFEESRIQDEKDWVRREIRLALELGIPVVLVCDSGLLPPVDLPDDIRDVTRKQAIPFYPEYFEAAVDRLIDFLGKIKVAKTKLEESVPPNDNLLGLSTAVAVKKASKALDQGDHELAIFILEELPEGTLTLAAKQLLQDAYNLRAKAARKREAQIEYQDIVSLAEKQATLDTAKKVWGKWKDQFPDLKDELDTEDFRTKFDNDITTNVHSPPGGPNRPYLKIIVIGLILVATSLTIISNLFGPPIDEFAELSCPATSISIAYATESQQYLPALIETFSTAHPLITITDTKGNSGGAITSLASGTAAKLIIKEALRPTIYQPSVNHWLYLIDHALPDNPYNPAEARDTAITWIVIAVWENGPLADIENLGWAQLLGYLEGDISLVDDRNIRFPHADPNTSSTALSSVILEYRAIARALGQNPDSLDPEDRALISRVLSLQASITSNYAINDPPGNDAIISNSDRKNLFDFRMYEENDVFYINSQLPEDADKLLARYPSDGSFQHTHPMAVYSDAEPCEKAAANLFIEHVRSAESQREISQYGFRPVNGSAPEDIFNPQYGLEASPNISPLVAPNATILDLMQGRWPNLGAFDYILVLDTSNSMCQPDQMSCESTEALPQAKSALVELIRLLPDEVAVLMIYFNGKVDLSSEGFRKIGESRAAIETEIQSQTNGPHTDLFGAMNTAIDEAKNQHSDTQRPVRIIFLTDGNHDPQDNPEQSGEEKENDERETIEKIQEVKVNSLAIVVFPIAYIHDGLTEDQKKLTDLKTIAEQFGRSVIEAPQDVESVIIGLFEQISGSN